MNSWAAPKATRSFFLKEILNGKADVLGDLAQEEGRDVSPGVERHGGITTIEMAKLLVRAALTHFFETELL